jgi:hypothetical protein
LLFVWRTESILHLQRKENVCRRVSEDKSLEWTKNKIGGNQKNVQLTIADTDILVSRIEGNMFFIYVTVKGTPSSDTPCGLDDTTSLAVAVDSYSIYRTGINYLQDLYVAGEIDREFIDFILRYKAFELCLKTRDFPLAITYWNRFWSNLPTSSLSKCNCNG